MAIGHATLDHHHAGPFRHRGERLLGQADVRIDGPRPWDMQVRDDRVFTRLLALGSLGLGESYMDGDWDAASLDGLLFRLLDARVDKQVSGLAVDFDAIRARLVNLQTPRRSAQVAKRHYDLGNDLYRAMLGPRMIYSCGYWRSPQGAVAFDLDTAQEAKLDLVCRKLGLQRGQRVMESAHSHHPALWAASYFASSGSSGASRSFRTMSPTTRRAPRGERWWSPS